MWNFLFGKKSRVPDDLPCDCQENSLLVTNRSGAPQLGVTPSGKRVTPHKCHLDRPCACGPDETPQPRQATSAHRVSNQGGWFWGWFGGRSRSRHGLRSSSSVASTRSHSHTRHEPSSSSTPMFPQFKSPTAPKYRPAVKSHDCVGVDHDTGDKHGGSRRGGTGFGRLWRLLLLLLLLAGLAGIGYQLVKFLMNRDSKCDPTFGPC